MSGRRGSQAPAVVLAALVWAVAMGAVAMGAGEGATESPVPEAKAAVLMGRFTGALLFEKAGHERRPMASTTKIMTALLVLEKADLHDWVTVSRNAPQVEPSMLDLKPGERMSVDDLLAALLLKSANDAAIALAEHVSGSVEEFAKLMNERARQVGAKDTHFVNPHGLYHADHYSSAYDLALITQEALKHARFRELVGMKAAEVSRPDLASREQVTNHNKLLWRESYVDGVKTGWVRRSGPCVVASGTKDGWQLIAVVLDSPDRYEDALSLLEYGFSTFRLKVYAREGDAVGQARVRRGRSGTLPAVCTKTLASVLGPGMPPEGRLTVKLDELKAPVAKGAKVGRAELEVAGKVADSCALVAGEAMEVSKLTMALVWGLRVLGLAALAAVTVRTGAKIIKARRRRWHSFPP